MNLSETPAHESRVTNHVRGPWSMLRVLCRFSLWVVLCLLDNKPVCHNLLDDQMGVLRERVSQRGRARSFRDARRETRDKTGGENKAGHDALAGERKERKGKE